jgi:hypothetical protein
MPYAAIGASRLPDGEYQLRFYAELHTADNDSMIARSEYVPFFYTK